MNDYRADGKIIKLKAALNLSPYCRNNSYLFINYRNKKIKEIVDQSNNGRMHSVRLN